MESFSDSGELYVIRNQFYTGQYDKVATYDLSLFSEEARPKVVEFQTRAKVALAEDASQLIEQARSMFSNQNELLDALQAWNDLNVFGTEDSVYFDSVESAEFETQASLTAIYLVKVRNDLDQAISLLSDFVSSTKISAHELEPYLLLTQLHLVNGSISNANKVYTKFLALPAGSRDDIIFHLLDSWFSACKGGLENVSKSTYFYEELLETDFEEGSQGKLYFLSFLFALSLQLHRFPEAQHFLDQIDALNSSNDSSGDLLANRITYEYLTKDGENVLLLLRELANVNPKHALLIDIKDKNAKLDAIVEKYQPSN